MLTTLTLDPQLEQRIQHEIALGHYHDPAEVISHALTLLTAEQQLLAEERAELDARLDESMAQIERRSASDSRRSSFRKRT